jgi:hypothetical protein
VCARATNTTHTITAVQKREDNLRLTIIYGTATPTPIPEFAAALELVMLVGCLAITLIIEKDLNATEASLPREQDDSENG